MPTMARGSFFFYCHQKIYDTLKEKEEDMSDES